MRMEHGGFVQRVEVSSDGQWIASTGFDQTVRIWDAASGSIMKEISLKGVGAALAFSPDGSRVIVGDRDGNVSIWDISELKARIGYIEFPEFVHKAKYNTTGEWVLFNSDDKNLWVLSNDQLISTHDGLAGTKILTLNNISAQFKISPDSKWIVVSETYGSSALLYNLETKVSLPLPLKADVTGLAFSPDSKKVAVTYADGQSVIIWEVDTGKQLDEITFDSVAFTSSYSPKDFTLAIAFKGKTVLWDAEKKKAIASLPQVGDIRSINFSKDGNWLATSSSEGSIYLWDMKENDINQPAYRLQQGGNITSLDFSYNNKWLASAGGNGFAYIWDLATGEEIARMSHSNSVTGVSFSADDSQLLTVSRKVVQVWDVGALTPIKTETIAEIACARLTENMTDSTWAFFFGDEPYQQICPNLPVGK
jgi:WD40 repeat protein